MRHRLWIAAAALVLVAGGCSGDDDESPNPGPGDNTGGSPTCQSAHHQLRRPVAPSVISQPYKGPYPSHSGIDYAGSRGTPVRAVAAGKVTLVKKLTTSYGKHVRVSHACGKTSLYAHLATIRVRVGQQVRQGQLIGRRGSTGNSTGPHTHFEMTAGGRNINPSPWIKTRGPGYGGFDPSQGKDEERQLRQSELEPTEDSSESAGTD